MKHSQREREEGEFVVVGVGGGGGGQRGVTFHKQPADLFVIQHHQSHSK